MSDKKLEVRVTVSVGDQFAIYGSRGESELSFSVPANILDAVLSELSRSISMVASSLLLPAYQSYQEIAKEQEKEKENE